MGGLGNCCSEKHRYVARGLRSEISADGQLFEHLYGVPFSSEIL